MLHVARVKIRVNDRERERERKIANEENAQKRTSDTKYNKHIQKKQAVRKAATICLRSLQIDNNFVFVRQVAVLFRHNNIFVFIRQVAPVPTW